MISRKLYSIILILAICFTMVQPTFAATDSPSNWALGEIEKAKTYNLVTERVLKNYQSNITREEFCELAVKLYEALSGKRAAIAENPFTDTSNQEVIKANQLGIVGGRGNGIFAPNDPVTRQEIAIMLMRTFRVAGLNVDTSTAVATFADEDQISTWAKEAIGFLNANGIMGGVGENKINPRGDTTKEQGIALVVRSYEFFKSLSKQTPPTNIDKTLDPVLVNAKASGAVVLINTFDEDDNFLGSGSGFIVESTGKIVTNYHVITGSHRATVKLTSGQEYEVERVTNYHPERDVIVLKIDAANLPTVALGDSDRLANGERVIAIGSPLGLENTISEGLISNKSRMLGEQTFIQTSAPISFGSSGGTLLNSKAEVVGVTTGGLYYGIGQNLNIAIPINEVKPYLSNEYNLTLPELIQSTKPKTPKNVKAEAISSSQIQISWDKVEEADYYHVYESYSEKGPFLLLTDEYGYPDRWGWDSDFCLEIYDIEPKTTMYFKVTAVRDGIESDLSKVTFATTHKPGELFSYDEYMTYLWETASGAYMGDKYWIDFNSIFITEQELDDGSSYIAVVYSVDDENYNLLTGGRKAGHQEDIEEFFADVVMELYHYYDKDVAGYMIYSSTWKEYPKGFEKNLFPVDTIEYDSSTRSWQVNYPFLEIIPENGHEYHYRWAQ